MSTHDDRPPATGEPVPPRWDAPPQPPAWDRPAGPQQGWGPPPSYGPGAGGGGDAWARPVPAQTESKAVVALVLAICSWVVLPFVAAVVALFVAGAARRDIAASGGRLGGEGLVTAARAVAWVNIVLCLLLVVLAVAALVLFVPVAS